MLRSQQSNLKSPRCSRPVEELPEEPPDACPPCSAPVVDLLREFAIFVDKAAQVSELGGLSVLLPRCFDDKWCWRRSPVLRLFLQRPHQESHCLLLRHCQAKCPEHFHDSGHHPRQPFLGSRYDAGVVGLKHSPNRPPRAF